MRISISVGGKFHSAPLGLQLKKQGYLGQFITSRPEMRHLLGDAVTAIPYPEYIGWAWCRLPLANRRLPFNLLKDNLFDVMALRCLKPCDLLVAWAHFALFTMRRAKELGVKVVVERGSAHVLTHHDLLSDEYRRFGLAYNSAHPLMIRKQLREYDEADIIMVPSHFAYDSFIAHGIDAKKLRLVPYGVDNILFSQPQALTKQTKFRVIFVGNIGLEKGVQYLLQAVKELGLPDLELVLVGYPDASGEMLLKTYQGVYHYIPQVPHNELSRHYQMSSVFVLPSLAEGHAMVTSEAMACGLPVIVSSNTGALARDGVDGFVVPPTNVEALKDKLVYLYQHRQEAREMGDNARRYISDNYTWDHYGKRVVEVYRELLGLH